MNYKDYYKIMGVDRDASQDEIKRAYRILARKYHPDVSKETDAEKKFKELGEAYEVLKDPEKRAAYNQLGSDWQAGQEFHPPPNWDAGFEFTDTDASAYSDFFESLFGHDFTSTHRTRRNIKEKGQDHHAKILVNIKDAYTGAEREISLTTPDVNSQGYIVNKKRVLKVKIPKGISSGQKIRLTGQGGQGFSGGPPGDLYLEIEFEPNKLFHVSGKDVFMDIRVTPWEAALGSTIKIPTPVDRIDLKIPPSLVSGRKLRVKSKGIPGEPNGDLYVTLIFELPPVQSEAARNIYKKMKDELFFDPRTDLEV